MADMTGGISSASNIITKVIFGLTNFLGNILNNIGTEEIVIALLIGVGIYFYFRQHNLEPVRIAKF